MNKSKGELQLVCAATQRAPFWSSARCVAAMQGARLQSSGLGYRGAICSVVVSVGLGNKPDKT